MKRMLFMLVAGLCMGCTSRDYAMPTQAGWRIFRYTEHAFGAHRALVLRAAQFDEYLRQPTEAERRRIHDLYFPRERIVEEENGWLILSTDYTWAFEIRDGKLLADEGAEWNIRFSTAEGGLLAEAVIGTADGALTANTLMRLDRFTCTAESGVRVSEDASGALSAEFFRGEGALRATETPALDIDYAISEPVVQGWNARAPDSGAIDIAAHNQAEGPTGADEAVTGRYLGEEMIEITYCGQKDRWSLMLDL
ncbi:hypothetical protein [Alistipes sp.]|uniref:hypothetical protein n=1 Tax=Alistipes sp. TaxID=1872444 RepID=UPI003AEFDCA3